MGLGEDTKFQSHSVQVLRDLCPRKRCEGPGNSERQNEMRLFEAVEPEKFASFTYGDFFVPEISGS